MKEHRMSSIKKSNSLESDKSGRKRKAKKNTVEVDGVALKKDLLVRVRHLHSVARDAMKIYLENLERDFLKAEGRLENGEMSKLKASVLKPVIRLIDQTSLKPEKGRRKDLKRIE